MAEANQVSKAELVRIAVEKFLEEVDTKGVVEFTTRIEGTVAGNKSSKTKP